MPEVSLPARFLPAFLAAALTALPCAAAPALAETRFITLGTVGGPITGPSRQQPANLLIVNGVRTLIDVGDGTAQALSRLRLPTARIDAVVITHLHFDHIGGLQALLGLRSQTSSPKPLQVFGPPGTLTMVQGLLASMAPSMAAGYGLPGQHIYTAAELVDVHEVGSGGTFRLGETRVAATRNSHFSFPPDSAEAARHLSLSYRFDTPDRSIVVTGDTGPSANVEALARGADLLVGEMIDVPLTVATIRKVDPGLTEQRLKDMTTHLSSHHLAPADLGAMAERAGVKTLVVTHLVPGEVMTIDHLNRYRTEIAARFGGTILMASDMDEF